MLKTLVISLAVTLVIELFLAFILKVRNRKGLLVVLLVNILTNPLAVLIHELLGMRFFGNTMLLCTAVIEIAVTASEAMIYMSFSKQEKYGIKRPVLLSVVSNTFSFFAGVGLKLIADGKLANIL